LLDAVKNGFGFNGAMNGFTLDDLADSGRFVVLSDNYGLGLHLVRLAGVVGVAIAEPSARAKEGDGQRQANQPGHDQRAHSTRPRASVTPCVVRMRSTALSTGRPAASTA